MHCQFGFATGHHSTPISEIVYALLKTQNPFAPKKSAISV
jgi:hypothetical protein